MNRERIAFVEDRAPAARDRRNLADRGGSCENELVEGQHPRRDTRARSATSGPFLFVAVAAIVATPGAAGQLRGGIGLLKFQRSYAPVYTSTWSWPRARWRERRARRASRRPQW